MTIPSHLPQFVRAVRPGALQTLALHAGQVVDAKVIGPAPNGGTQVEIRGQLLNLVMPTLVKAGETIRFEVQGTGQQMRLALQLAAPPATAPGPPPPAPAPAVLPSVTTAPATTPQPQRPPGQPLPTGSAANLSTLPQAAAQLANLVQKTVTTSPNAAPAAMPTERAAGLLPHAALPPTSTPSPAHAAPSGAIAAAVDPASTQQGPSVTRVVTVQAPPLPGGAPYPVASPALPNPLATAAAAVATMPAATAPSQAATITVAPVQPAVAIGGSTAHAAGRNPTPQPPPQAPASPQAALAQMAHASIPRQASITALTTALTAIAGKVALPEPVARAAQQVLAGRVAIDAPRFDGTALQTAIRGSGIFHEAGLARGQTALPQTDMKAALLTLRQTLTTWLGQQAAVNPIAHIPPPLRGVTPRARAVEAPPLDTTSAPEEVGKQLLERTESALARVRLHQHASLPDTINRTADWSLDLPVMVGTQQTLLHLQIHQDDGAESEGAGDRGWQMRFALNLPQMGEVGAQVTLRTGTTGVMLWATEPATSAALEGEIEALRENLASAGLRAGAVIVRHGEPPVHTPPAPSGHVLDASS